MDERHLVMLVLYVVFAFIVGSIAHSKNRNAWAWGLFGGFCFVVGLLALMLLPHLCPRCNRPLTKAEWESRRCPTCGDVEVGTEPCEVT